MFTKKTNNATINENFSANTIQQGTSIDGNIVSNGSIRIDGKLVGNLTTKAKVVVGKTGHIIGNIICQNASIEGKVQGNLLVDEMLDLRATAVIDGDIKLSKFVVEPSAVFNGNCKMDAKTSVTNMVVNGNFEQQKTV